MLWGLGFFCFFFGGGVKLKISCSVFICYAIKETALNINIKRWPIKDSWLVKQNRIKKIHFELTLLCQPFLSVLCWGVVSVSWFLCTVLQYSVVLLYCTAVLCGPFVLYCNVLWSYIYCTVVFRSVLNCTAVFCSPFVLYCRGEPIDQLMVLIRRRIFHILQLLLIGSVAEHFTFIWWIKYSYPICTIQKIWLLQFKSAFAAIKLECYVPCQLFFSIIWSFHCWLVLSSGKFLLAWADICQ